MKKLLSGKKEKQILLAIIALIGCGLLYYFIYMPKVKEKEKLVDERDMISLQLSNEEDQTAKVEQLKLELNELNSDMSIYSEDYFVDRLQERYIYIMADIMEKSGATLIKSTYDTNFDDTFMQALSTIKKTEASEDEETVTDDLLEIYVMSAEVEIRGTYKQIKDFVIEVTNNKEKIIIKSLKIETKEKKVETYVNDNQDPLFLKSILDKNGNHLLNATIILEFYSIPDAAKFGEPEELGSWDLKNSASNPFDAGTLNVHPIEKQQIFVFSNGDYSAGDIGKEEINIISEDDREYVTYSYNLGEVSEKYIPLENKNIVIEEGQNIVGLIVKSDEITFGKIYITIVDANGKPQTVELADEIYWTGWASLQGIINKDMAYPIKVSRVEVHKDPANEEVISGTLTLDSIFAGKTTIYERITETVKEETPAE